MTDDLAVERAAAELFDASIDLPNDDRKAFLDERAGSATPLRARVERLLALASGRTPAGLSPPTQGFSIVPELATGAMLGGRFRVLEEIGQGGLGIVYRAEQTEPVRRRVAIKVLRPGLADPRIRARFDAELSVLALLNHPHIAQVIDGGRATDGRPFIAMELVEGVPLSAHVDGKDLDQRLRLFAAICRAVHHAHQKGVVHRDLKPSNILVVDLEGGAAPKIIDFGVARVTRDALPRDLTLTAHGEPIGTPTYMSPEQAGIGTASADARSDIYSLGVVLFELLTGVVPFGPDTLARWGWLELQRALAERDPERPSLVLKRRRAAGSPTPLGSQAFPADLDAVVGMALEKSPDARYPSASELAAEVERVLRGEPVLARPPSAGDRAWRFVRRHRLAFTAGAVALLAIIAAGVAVGVMAIARASEESIARADAEAGERIRARGALRAAEAALAMSDGVAARANLERIAPAYRGWEWDYRLAQSDQSLATLATGFRAFSVAIGGGVAAGGSVDGEVRTWDVVSYRPLARARVFDGEVGVLVSADGKTVLACDDRTALLGLDAATGATRWRVPGRFTLGGGALSADGATFVTGAAAGRAIEIRQLDDGRVRATVPVDDELVRVPQWLDDERLIYTDGLRTVIVGRDGGVRASLQASLLQAAGGLKRFVANPGPLYGQSALYDSDTLAVVRDASGDAGYLALLPGSGAVITVDVANALELRDADGARVLQRLIGSGGTVWQVAGAPDAPLAVTADHSGDVRLWSTLPAPSPFTVAASPEYPWLTCFDARRGRLVLGGWGFVQGFDAVTGAELWHQAVGRGYVRSLALDRAGQRIAVGDDRGHLALLDADDGRVLSLSAPLAERTLINAIAWSPDDRELVLGLGQKEGRGELARYDVRRGAIVQRVAVGPSRVSAAVFDATDTMLATGGGTGDDWPVSFWKRTQASDNSVRLWSWPNLTPLGTFPGHSAPVRWLAWSPVASDLLSTAADGTVRLWHMPAGTVETRRAAGGVSGATFSRDGRRFFTAHESRQVIVWDASDAEQLTYIDTGVALLTGIGMMADDALVGSARSTPVVRLEPPPPPALRVLRQDVAAARAAREASAQSPNPNRLNGQAWALVMRAGASLEEVVAAEAAAESAIALMPDTDFWHTLALAHVRSGRYDDALVALAEAVRTRGVGLAIDEPVRALALAGLGDDRCADAVAAGLGGIDPRDEQAWSLQLEAEVACDGI